MIKIVNTFILINFIINSFKKLIVFIYIHFKKIFQFFRDLMTIFLLLFYYTLFTIIFYEVIQYIIYDLHNFSYGFNLSKKYSYHLKLKYPNFLCLFCLIIYKAKACKILIYISCKIISFKENNFRYFCFTHYVPE